MWSGREAMKNKTVFIDQKIQKKQEILAKYKRLQMAYESTKDFQRKIKLRRRMIGLAMKFGFRVEDT